MDVRVMRPSDIPAVQLANLTNLPENYFLKYYLYHALSWPQLSHVAIDTSSPPSNPKIVGYVLAKIDEDNPRTGHITSLSVMRTHRRLGLAEKLMKQATRAMREYHSARDVSLHVRCSNEAAIGLYTGRLGFTRDRVEKGYYADGEDAWCMRLEIEDEDDEADGVSVGEDDHGEVGDEGRQSKGQKKNERKRKVKMGRGLGVGELVEKDDSQREKTTSS